MICKIVDDERSEITMVEDLQEGVMYRANANPAHIYIKLGNMIYSPTALNTDFYKSTSNFTSMTFYPFKGTLEVS